MKDVEAIAGSGFRDDSQGGAGYEKRHGQGRVGGGTKGRSRASVGPEGETEPKCIDERTGNTFSPSASLVSQQDHSPLDWDSKIPETKPSISRNAPGPKGIPPRSPPRSRRVSTNVTISSWTGQSNQLWAFLPSSLKICQPTLSNCTENTFQPFVQELEGCCMFIDISGFSTVSDKLCTQSLRGPEQVGNYLNSSFSQIVRLVLKSGGDVLKFAGDALIVLWPVDKTNENCPTLTTAVQRAIQCGLDIQETIPVVKLNTTDQWSFKIGIGAGPVALVHVGGSIDIPQREYMAMGEAVYGAFEAEKFAQPVGEVICAPHAIKTVTGYFEFEDVDNSGFAKVNAQRILIKKRNRVAMDATQRSVYSELHARRYVPTEVLEYYSLLRNRGDMRDWASEVRNVSVLFIHLGLNVVNVNLSHPDTESIQHLNTAVYEVQQAVVNYDGFINKVNLDDKGITAIAVFGLAPKSHENDATRAVLAALRIVAVVEEKIGAEVSVGITSNLCFCGVVGHRSGRKEYTVIGDAVNLAARLMQTAKADQLSRILTDVRTYMLVGEEVAFAKTAREIKVKGKLARIKVFSPSVKGHFDVVRRWRSSSIDCKARRSIGGAVSNDWKHAWESQVSRYGAQRLHDMRDFYQPLQRVSSDHLASPNSLAKRLPRKGAAVTMITGDIGSGRTHVLSLVWHRLTLRCDTMVLVAAANPFQGPNHVPSWKFRVWVRLIECAMASKEDVAPSSTNCEICADPFDSTNQQLTQRRQALLSSWLAQAPEAATSLTDKWVLNDLFGVHFPKHSESKFESEPHEIDTLRIHMLVTLLRGIACKEQVNVVCLIDDTDSIPDLAWDVATKLAESHTLKDGVSVILTCERRKGKMPGHKAARALAQKNFSTVDVETVPQLGRVQLESLARNHLGVLSIPDDLADMVELLSHGNPLLAQSLVDELQKLELLVVDRENLLCKWAPKAKRRRSTSDARKTRTIFACTVENLLKDVPSKSPWTSPVETFKKSLRGSHYEDRAKGLPRTASTSVLASARKVSGHKLPSAFKLLLNEAVRPDKKFMERSKHSEHSTHKNDSPKFEVRRYSAAVYLNELTALTIEPPLIYNVVYGAWLNELSFRELLLLKIASMAVINSTATFRKVPVVQAALIIMPTATAARIEEDLVRLTKSRLLTTANDDTSARNAAQFTFVHWLMPRVLRLRTLESQRAEILRCLDESSRHYEAGIRRVFLDRVHGWMDLNTPIKHGQVYIHKQLSGTSAKWSGGRLINRRHSVGSSWKRRFATLYPDRIVLFRDAGCLRKAGVIFLSDAEVQFEEAGFGGHSFVFKIDAQRWMKHKNSSHFEHARSFYFNPVENTRDGVDDWIFKVRLAIESTKKGLPFCEEKGDVPRMRRYTVASAVPLTFLAA